SQDPYPTYDELRKNHRIHYDPVRDLWTVSRYADAVRVLKSPDDFTSALASFESTLLGAEPQAHARVRRLTGRIFTAEQTSALAHFIRTTAQELVNRVSAQGRCELVSALAAPLPIAVIALILGIDRGWT